MQYRLKKISGDASFREFYRIQKGFKSSIIVVAKKDKFKNLVTYSAVNKILNMNGILAPNLLSNFINEKIIDYIFDKINIDKGSFVEFGAWDGKINSNARNLFHKGWKGLFIESDSDRFNQLSVNYKSKKNIYLSSSHIDFEKNKLDNEIENSLNNPIDFMSIDVDGLDLEIFKTIQKFFPTVLCIEGGQVLEPYQNIVNNKIAKQNVQQSLYQMNKIIEKRGYKLVCAYQDAFFILEDKMFLISQASIKNVFFSFINGSIIAPLLEP